MKKNRLSSILGVTFLITCLMFICFIVMFISLNTHNKKHNELTFPKSIIIDNATKDKNIDMVLMILANKIFKYDSIHITVFPMFIDTLGNILYLAYTQKFPFFNHNYVMFVNDKLPYEKMKLVLCHEMRHIYQLESKQLVETYNKKYTIYKNDTVFYDKVDYADRPFEKDAFEHQDEILKTLNTLIDATYIK